LRELAGTVIQKCMAPIIKMNGTMKRRGQGALSGGFASLARPICNYIGPALNETKTK